MCEIPVFHDILTIFALSIVVLLVCHRLHLPNIVGFLLTGILCGPHGLELIEKVSDVDIMADMGLVLLLFMIGMEVSLKKIIELRKAFLIGGIVQLMLTTGFAFALAYVLGYSIGQSLFLGFLLTLSSTAIVLRCFDTQKENDTPHGRTVLAILIFQDVCSIPMMLLIPYLGNHAIEFNGALLLLLLKAIILLCSVFFAARIVIPKLLDVVAHTRSRELFLLCVLTICMTVAWLASQAGLSTSLGAFLAGLIIAESEYSHEAISDILPFRDIFTSFFFVSVGMLLNVHFVIENPLTVIVAAAMVLTLKWLCATTASMLSGLHVRYAIMSGLALCQVGEFSFVLANEGSKYQLASDYHFQLFIAVSIITMAIAPWLINRAHKFAEQITKLPLPQSILNKNNKEEGYTSHIRDGHTIIVGFGLAGKNIARATKEANIPYAVLEMNPETVKNEKKAGQPIYFGDATHPSILEHLSISTAKIITVVINDSTAALRIVKLAKSLNPNVYIIARVRYVQEMELMHKFGADVVIPDEFGSSIEVFTRVLRQYQTPAQTIQNFINELRIEGYDLLRWQESKQENMNTTESQFA